LQRGTGKAQAMDTEGTTDRVVSQLQEALASRDIIGQAKGIIMERNRVDADTAFEMLKSLSQRTNRKLRDIAQDVVNSVNV
jgi:AmiR/NasT family two-component response regulator